MPKPIVTVILPAKDTGAFVGTTLTTLARQFDDRSALKLVAINDGSTDDTGAQMRRFAERLEHAEVIDNPEPVGLASARNQGLEHVEGDFFCFVDGDDWMHPRRLEALVESMKTLGCDFVRTDHVTVTEDRRQLVRAPYAWRGRAVSPREAILPASETTMVDYPYAWAGMFHRRLIDSGLASFPAGLFTAEDRPWIWRLHLDASSFAVVDAPVILYRRGVPSSLTQVLDRRQLDFIPAFTLALEHVMNDREAERFLPKILATTLARLCPSRAAFAVDVERDPAGAARRRARSPPHGARELARRSAARGVGSQAARARAARPRGQSRMTQIFVLNSAYGLMTAVAAIDGGLIPPTDGERLLLTVNAAPVPEATPDLVDAPHLRSILTRFDHVESLNDLVAPIPPTSWNPAVEDHPFLERTLRRAWGAGVGAIELFVQTPQIAPSRTLMTVFASASITVVGDGLMTYSPIRDRLPRTVTDRLAGEPAATVLVLGQYLAALGLVSDEEELRMQCRMVDEAARAHPRRIVFKPHPSARPASGRELAERTSGRGIAFDVYEGDLPAEVVAARVAPVGIVAGFSSALPSLHALSGAPIAAVGNDVLLSRLRPYENGNRVPVTIVDAMTRPDSPYTSAADLQLLIDAVGYCMQPAIMAHLRPRAAMLLSTLSETERARYFSRARLQELRLAGAPRPTLASRLLTPRGGVGRGEQLRLLPRRPRSDVADAARGAHRPPAPRRAGAAGRADSPGREPAPRVAAQERAGRRGRLCLGCGRARPGLTRGPCDPRDPAMARPPRCAHVV